MNESLILTALWMLRHLRLTSPPVGTRTLRNSVIAGCDTSRYAAYAPLRVLPCLNAVIAASTVWMKGIGPGDLLSTSRTADQ